MAAARVTDRARPSAAVVFYIACEVFRRYYDDVDTTLASKLQRNIRRNHRVTVDRAVILSLAEKYAKAYDYGASILPKHIGPSKGRYADWHDVRIDAYRAALKKRYPREPRGVVDGLAWYTIHYEHLR